MNLALRRRDRRQRRIEHDGARRCRALIDGEEVGQGRSPHIRGSHSYRHSGSRVSGCPESIITARAELAQSMMMDSGWPFGRPGMTDRETLSSRKQRCCSRDRFPACRPRTCAARGRNSRPSSRCAAGLVRTETMRACSAFEDTGLSRYSLTPRFHRGDHARALAIGGEHDDRHVRIMETLPGERTMAHEFRTVRARHFPIEDDKVGADVRGWRRARSGRRSPRGCHARRSPAAGRA